MPNLQNIIPNIPDKNKNSPDPALRQFRDSDVNAIKSSLIKAQQNFEELTGSIPPITEETDHLRTTKPIREAPFSATDVYIKENQLGEGFVKVEQSFNVPSFQFGPDFEIVTVNGIPTIYLSGNAPAPDATIDGFYNYTLNTSPTPKTITFDFTGCPVGNLMMVAFGTTFTTSGGTSSIQMTEPAGWDRIFYGQNGPQILVRKREVADSDTFVFQYNHTSAPSAIGLSISNFGYTNGQASQIVVGGLSAENNTTPKTLPAVALAKQSLCLAFISTSSTNTSDVNWDVNWNKQRVELGLSGGTRSISLASRTVNTSSGDAIATLTPTANNNLGLIIAL